jgi:phytanoyl-CoA hydroxylase
VSAALTNENRTEYRREGVCVLRAYLELDLLESIKREIAELFAIQAEYLGLPVARGFDRTSFRTNALGVLRADVQRYIAAARVTQDLPSVHRLLVSEPVVELARFLGVRFPLISTKASVHLMDDELKIPNGYHKSPAHQDWRSIQGSLDNVVLWIPSTPVRGGVNGIEVIRGSHLLGLLETSEHIMTPTVTDARLGDERYEPIDVEPGDVIAFSSFLVHRTAEKGDGLVRVAVSTRFTNAAEPTFVERGFPTPYKYSYQRDLITPNFPPTELVTDIFRNG